MTRPSDSDSYSDSYMVATVWSLLCTLALLVVLALALASLGC
jgi:hypothetical protein